MLVYPQPLNLETRAARLLTMSSGYRMLQRLQGKQDYLGGLVFKKFPVSTKAEKKCQFSHFLHHKKGIIVLFQSHKSQKVSIKLRAEHPSNHIKHETSQVFQSVIMGKADLY